MTAVEDLLDRAAAAALSLAAHQPWSLVSLRLIAETAGVSLADLYAAAPSKRALLTHLSRRFDRAALTASTSGELKEQLFEVVMARFEVMEPHRLALAAMAKAEGPLSMAGRLAATARACLEAAGIDATAPRLAGMAVLLAKLYPVWRDDGSDLGRTMDELERRLVQLRDSLAKIGAGF